MSINDKIVIKSRIEEKLNEYRLKRDLTWYQTAKLLGYNSRQSLMIVIKNNNPKLDILIQVSLLINVEINDLFEVQIVENKKLL